MGYYGQPSDFDKLERRLRALQLFNAFYFVVSLLLALACFGICIWIRFDLDFRVWVRELNWYSYWYCTYVIMIGMVLVVVNSVVGVLGVMQERTGILLCTQWMLGILFFWQLIGATVILVWGVEESKTLTKELNEVFLDLVYKWDIDPRASWVLKQIQEYVGCCGADGSDDFIHALKPVPMECRDRITGVEYGFGCQQQLAWWLEPWSSTLAAICCFLCLADILGIFTIQQLRKTSFELGQYDN